MKRKLEENNISCSRCCKVLPPDSKFKGCSKCRARQRIAKAEHTRTEPGAFQKHISNMQQHSEKGHKKRRKYSGACTITRQELLAIYVNQGRRCAISGLPLTHISGSDWQTSPNRIDDNRDYDNNVEIVALEFNTRAKWTPTKLAELPARRRQVLTAQDIDERVALLDQSPKRPQQIAKCNELGQWLCLECGTFKSAGAMTKGAASHTLCKVCTAGRHRKTIRAELKLLLCNAHYNTKVRNEKQKARNMIVDIDIRFLIKLIQKQGFRCGYSGVPLEFPSLGPSDPLWRISLERMDPRLGYTKDNVCLIAAGFQSVDHTRTRKNAGTGSGGWSSIKVNYVLQWLREKAQGATAPSLCYADFVKQS